MILKATSELNLCRNELVGNVIQEPSARYIYSILSRFAGTHVSCLIFFFYKEITPCSSLYNNQECQNR